MHNADGPLDRDLMDALDTLDYPVRHARADEIIRRARARRAQRRWRFVAAAVVMLGASAAAALPGSPVRRWIEAAVHAAASTDGAPPKAPARLPSAVPAPANMRGVVTSVGDSAEVVFTAWQDTGDVVIRFIPEAELRIRATAVPVSFQVRPAGILVNNVGASASYQLDIAAAASDLRVLAAGQAIFERRNGRVVRGPLPLGDGTYVVTLRPGRTR